MNQTNQDDTTTDVDLDAADVEAAIAQRAEEQLRSGKVREAFYNSYAYMSDLQEFALDAGDIDLKESIKVALNHLDSYRQTLDIGYKWD